MKKSWFLFFSYHKKNYTKVFKFEGLSWSLKWLIFIFFTDAIGFKFSITRDHFYIYNKIKTNYCVRSEDSIIHKTNEEDTFLIKKSGK